MRHYPTKANISPKERYKVFSIASYFGRSDINVQLAMCNVKCAISNVQLAMCNVQCAISNVQCEMSYTCQRRSLLRDSRRWR